MSETDAPNRLSEDLHLWTVPSLAPHCNFHVIVQRETFLLSILNQCLVTRSDHSGIRLRSYADHAPGHSHLDRLNGSSQAPEVGNLLGYFEEFTFFGPGADRRIREAREQSVTRFAGLGEWMAANSAASDSRPATSAR